MQKNIRKLRFLSDIRHKLSLLYRHNIVYEQYPFLSHLSKRRLLNNGAIGVVYMLHHIAPKSPDRIPTNEDLKVTPEFLEKLIIRYKKQNIDFISLDELSNRLTSQNMHRNPFVSFTIDDGYLDNYTQAFPVFQRNNVPFAIFVATDFIEKKSILWWDSIEELILTNDYITIKDGTRYPCLTFQQRWDTFRYLRERILKLNQTHIKYELENMFDRYDIDWLEPIKKKGMSWSQIIELSKHPLCTIGGHTVSHPALNMLNDSEFQYEIKKGIENLEAATGNKIEHFAYPYGSTNEIGERERQLIRELGFKTVFRADGGCITLNDMHHTQNLPRVYLHNI